MAGSPRSSDDVDRVRHVPDAALANEHRFVVVAVLEVDEDSHAVRPLRAPLADTLADIEAQILSIGVREADLEHTRSMGEIMSATLGDVTFFAGFLLAGGAYLVLCRSKVAAERVAV